MGEEEEEDIEEEGKQGNTCWKWNLLEDDYDDDDIYMALEFECVETGQ